LDIREEGADVSHHIRRGLAAVAMLVGLAALVLAAGAGFVGPGW
jgi:hypothetical protein